MIIYKCIITGDEMFTDTYKIKESEDGIFFEVEGRMTTRCEKFDDALIGANASAEEASEGTDESSQSGVDIVLNHKLQETGFKKSTYLPYIKAYLKVVAARLAEKNPGRVDKFKADSQEAVKVILKNISDYQFFMGESLDADGTVGLLNYREDGITPFMLFFKDGLEMEKC